MAIKFSVAVRNARLDAFETAIGTGAVLKIRSGVPPANITDADAGTVLATLVLPSDWMAAASAGAKAKLGTWEDLVADNPGVAGHFRIYASDGVTQHMQGTITAVGGGGDMEIDNINIGTGKSTVATFTLTDGNA